MKYFMKMILDVATKLLVDKIKNLIQTSSTCKIKKNKPKMPWVTNEIVILVNKKEKIYKHWQKNVNNLKLGNAYYKIAKQIRKSLEKAIEIYEENLIDKFKNNQKRIWEFVNSKIK